MSQCREQGLGFVLALRIVDGPVFVIVFVLACAGLALLCIRRVGRWAEVAAGAAAAGVLGGVIGLWLAEGVSRYVTFGGPVTERA